MSTLGGVRGGNRKESHYSIPNIQPAYTSELIELLFQHFQPFKFSLPPP